MAEVIGAISGVVALIETSIKIYDRVKNDIKLSETFEVVRCRLPVILHTLETCKNNLKQRADSIPQDVCDALEEILEACYTKAKHLREILEKIESGERHTWMKRYSKILRSLGKGNKIEELMLGLVKDVQLIVNHHAVRFANQQQKAELDDIVQQMKSFPSSVPEDESPTSFNSGGGTLINNVNRNSGGQHINNYGHGSISMSVGTQNYNSGKDWA